MKIIEATEAHAQAYVDQVPELFWSTGPQSYDYQFGSRDVLDPLIRASWLEPNTLFSYDAATLALDGDTLVGFEVGFTDPGFRDRAAALGTLWGQIISSGELGPVELDGLGRRIGECSWLNPTIPEGIYYIHALSVSQDHRGEGIGAALLRNSLQRAEEAGLPMLQLDVLSDNAAVDFYRAFGLECVVESKAPIPFRDGGVPTELRMEKRFA